MNDSDLVKSSLNDETKFRLNKMNKIKDYFNSEIKERKAISKTVVNALLLLIVLTKLLLFFQDLLVL